MDLGPIPSDAEIIAKISAAAAAADTLLAHRAALSDARSLLLDYGTPDGLPFAETYSAVQTAALDYRDAGINDKECEEHIQWITARTGQITAAALHQAGLLQ
jgi:hypothetical protein